MPKFYPHNIEHARQRSDDRLKKAQAAGNVRLGEYNLLHLEEIAETGLPDCYKNFDEFLYDFFPDFSWTPRAFKREVEYILSQTERTARVNEAIKAEWGCDIMEILKQDIEETDSIDSDNE